MTALMKFDTLSWAKKLEKVGVPSQQAEVQVELIFKAIDNNICTKQDLHDAQGNINFKIKELGLKIEDLRRDLELKLELKIEDVRRELMVTIEQVKGSINSQIARWVFGVSAIQTSVLIIFMRSRACK